MLELKIDCISKLYIRHDRSPERLRDLGPDRIEAFVRSAAPRLARASLKHAIAHLRSFLRFLAASGRVSSGLDSSMDTPRVYRREQLPRAIPWETVCALLRTIDRSSSLQPTSSSWRSSPGR